MPHIGRPRSRRREEELQSQMSRLRLVLNTIIPILEHLFGCGTFNGRTRRKPALGHPCDTRCSWAVVGPAASRKDRTRRARRIAVGQRHPSMIHHGPRADTAEWQRSRVVGSESQIAFGTRTDRASTPSRCRACHTSPRDSVSFCPTLSVLAVCCSSSTRHIRRACEASSPNE